MANKKTFKKAVRPKVMKKSPSPGTVKPPGVGSGTVNPVSDKPCQITPEQQVTKLGAACVGEDCK